MIVYCTTNIITGNKYIGKDAKNNPNYLGSGKIFKSALSKYGRSNFTKEILAYAKDLKDLSELEIYYINYYNADKSELFYNITKGGEGGYIYPQDDKKKPVLQFSLEGEFIKEWDSATEAAKEIFGKRCKIVRSCTLGFSHRGFLWKRKEDNALTVERKIQTFNKKKIAKFTKDGELIEVFDSVKQLATNLKVNKSAIYDYLKGCNSRIPFILKKVEI